MNRLMIAVPVLLLALFSCKKDKEAPVISVQQPLENATLNEGGSLHIEAVFSDDRKLALYRVYMSDQGGASQTEFPVNFSDEIKGTSYAFHEVVEVPAGIDSVYYLYLEVTDAKDNTTSKKIKINVEP